MSTLEAKYKKHKIIPEIIDSAPKQPLKVTYNGIQLTQGNELTPTQVKSQPTISWESPAEKDSPLYTLIFTDPDASISRANPALREILHWLVVNIPSGNVEKGEVLADFLPSGPPKGTGNHRYVYLLFKQQQKIVLDGGVNPYLEFEVRKNFSTKEFLKKYGLNSVPDGGNFYLAQWDEFVDVFRKQLVDSGRIK